jgi:hypothetical protein
MCTGRAAGITCTHVHTNVIRGACLMHPPAPAHPVHGEGAVYVVVMILVIMIGRVGYDGNGKDGDDDEHARANNTHACCCNKWQAYLSARDARAARAAAGHTYASWEGSPLSL